MNCFGIYSTYSDFGWKMWLWKHIISILSYTDKVFSNHSLLCMLRFCGIISAQAGSKWFPNECSLFFFLNEQTSGIPTCPTSATVLVTRVVRWSWICFRCNACHPSLEHSKGGKSTVYLSGGTCFSCSVGEWAEKTSQQQ